MPAYQRLYIHIVLSSMALCLKPTTGAALIKSLQPMSVLAPIGAMVKFTCVVNTTELKEFFDITWEVAGVLLPGDSNQAVNSNGSLRIGTLQQRVSEDHASGVPVQCAVLTINPLWEISVIRKSENATLTAYGPPDAPSNLTSTQSSDNALILSWSAPSSPVQLHYTVTVWTNTSTITMFNTSSTTITISRDNITTSDSTSECDQYVWSVTAINPAGTSTPTNNTTPISFVSAQYCSNTSVSVLTSSVMSITSISVLTSSVIPTSTYTSIGVSTSSVIPISTALPSPTSNTLLVLQIWMSTTVPIIALLLVVVMVVVAITVALKCRNLKLSGRNKHKRVPNVSPDEGEDTEDTEVSENTKETGMN